MKRQRTFILLLLIAVLIAFAWHRRSQHGPVYQGRPVSEWVALALKDDDSGVNDAAHTVVKIGAPAVPFIIEQGLYDKKHLFLNKKIEWLRWHLPEKIRWRETDPCNGRHGTAAWMLSEIGKPAHAAVPDIINCIEHCPDNHYVQWLDLIDALRDVSEGNDEAVPYLTKFANNTNYTDRLRAAVNVYYIKNGETNLMLETIDSLAKLKPDELLGSRELFWVREDHEMNRHVVPLLVKLACDPHLTIEQRASALSDLEDRTNDISAALLQKIRASLPTPPAAPPEDP